MAKSTARKQSSFLRYYFISKQNIFTYLFNVIKSIFARQSILHAKGTHFVSAYPGGGKTLLMSHLINDVDKSKYFFISNMAEFNDVKTIDIEKIFFDNKQNFSIPTKDEHGRTLYAIIFDEINLNFNKRLNRKTTYNDIFIGLVEFLVSHRHQDIPRIYFIGQKLELQDTQLISLFKYHHDIIKCKRWPFYWFYKENKYIDFIPRKLIIDNYVKDFNDNFLLLSTKKVKIKENDLKSYDTKYLGNLYKNLPPYKL